MAVCGKTVKNQRGRRVRPKPKKGVTALVYIPDAPVLRLRRILSRRRHFVKVCTMQINGAKSVLRSVGLAGEAASLTTVKAWEKLLRRSSAEGMRFYLSLHAL